MYINDLHVLHTNKPPSRLKSVNTRYEIYLCTELVYIWLQVLCKGAYTCHNIHDEIFAEFDFEKNALQFRMAGENGCIVHTLPARNLHYFIFKKRI